MMALSDHLNEELHQPGGLARCPESLGWRNPLSIRLLAGSAAYVDKVIEP